MLLRENKRKQNYWISDNDRRRRQLENKKVNFLVPRSTRIVIFNPYLTDNFVKAIALHSYLNYCFS